MAQIAPLIEPDPKSAKRPVRIHLDKETRRLLIFYSKYCGASIDRVVRGSLNRLFEQDDRFKPWLDENEKKIESDRIERKERLRARRSQKTGKDEKSK